VAQFLEHWLEDVVKPANAWKTYASYAELIRLHAIPALGKRQLAQLAPQHVAAMLTAKLNEGLSPRRVHNLRAVLRNALNQAIRWGLVTRNAASLAPPPRIQRTEVTPYTVDQARALISVAQEHRLGALFQLALMTGLRQGEVLGLQWHDVDLSNGSLRVRQALQAINGQLQLKEPKNDYSRRTLPLAPSLVAVLRQHQLRQQQERNAAGGRWVVSDFVFTSTEGKPLWPRNVLRVWHQLLIKVGLPPGPFHTCRHTAVSLLAADGVRLQVVQRTVGHSQLSTTADIYGHLFPDDFQPVADAMERLLA
jgi:integrase